MEKFSLWELILSVIFALLMMHNDVNSDMINMKIVDEPSSYGLSNSFGGLYQSQEDKLTMRVVPANFSGPAHIRWLVGKCFDMIDDNYKYEFCPFSNVTQHEQSLRWNPYSGVLGVYQEWQIDNNTFEAMVLGEGDTCGDIFRSVKVFFKCGNKSQITTVSEPNTCQYHMDFLTPLACHKHAMLVYPTLTRELQSEWNTLEGELVREEVTKQGYKKKLNKIFEKAGFHLSKERKKLLSKPPETKKEEPVKTEQGEFTSMQKCTEEVTKLREEVEQLREALLVHGLKQFQREHEVPVPVPQPQETAANTTNHADPVHIAAQNTSHLQPPV